MQFAAVCEYQELDHLQDLFMEQQQLMEDLRSELSKSREQIRQLEEKLQTSLAPPAVLFPTLISDTAAIISTFLSVISHLNRGAAPAPIAKPQALQLPAHSTSSSPMLCSPVITVHPAVSATPPHSPVPSPHATTTSSGSPALTPSTTPEGSPVTPSHAPVTLNLEPTSDEDQLSHDQHLQWRSNRKRKCMPRRVVKLPVSNNDQGGETQADDGFTWRKYGQKDILNSKYPRSYYRCTHQKEMGCPATKYVQKCEEDMYQVTYIGDHSCHAQGATSLGGLWSSSPATRMAGAGAAVARPLLDSIHPFQQQHSSGGTSTSTSSSFLLPARFEDMKAARLALSPSRVTTGGVPSGFNLLRPSSGALVSPSQWLTPKFGGLSCPIKHEPIISASLSITQHQLQLQHQDQQQHQQQPQQQELKGNGDTEQMLKMSLSSLDQPAATTASTPGLNQSNNDSIINTGGGSTSNSASDLHELWSVNLEELPGLLDNKVVVDASDIAVSASLEHLPMIGAYDEDDNHFSDPMLFEPSSHHSS